ncbi:hypothetical protein [Hyphomicrobium zavarzinii]|uniref:hypothetical protein n=1 Tax=Hyphomicrobium zavarzinii TaxID=48292 RepID=UPI00037CA35E|nr:hypothetical protein [Hyphomicrobium zavarzinii]
MTKRITTIPAMIKGLGGAEKVAQFLGTSATDVRSWAKKRSVPPGWHLRLSLWGKHFGFDIANGVFGLPEKYPADLKGN